MLVIEKSLGAGHMLYPFTVDNDLVNNTDYLYKNFELSEPTLVDLIYNIEFNILVLD